MLLDLDGDLYIHLGRVMHIQALANSGMIESEDANQAEFAKLMLPPSLGCEPFSSAADVDNAGCPGW